MVECLSLAITHPPSSRNAQPWRAGAHLELAGDVLRIRHHRTCIQAMPKASTESLEAFLQRQPSSALAAVLMELAADHEAVQQRLARMQLSDRPDKLAASFKKTLAAWRRST